MKILQISNKVPYPDNDGGTIACLNMAKGFYMLGNEVTILSMATRKHKVSAEQIPEPVKKIARFVIVDVPAPITLAGALKNLFFSNLPYNAERFIDKDFDTRLANLLKEEKFDIIQLEGLYVCPYIETIRKFSSAKIVYRAHNIESEIWERSLNFAQGLKKWYLKILLKRLKKFETGFLNKYDLLVPITPRDGEIFKKAGNKQPLFVSQTGYDISEINPVFSTTGYPSVFYIGALDWAPNQEGLVWFIDHCWKIISNKHPDLKFYIAGRNAPGWLVKKTRGKNIVFLGEIENASQFIRSKSVMVVPLFSGSGMRIKIVEGMALGKAIVTTPIGTEGISTTNRKNIFITDTAGKFAGAVCELVENKFLCEKTGAEAIRYIKENFDNQVLASKLTGFYKNQLGWD